MKKTSDQTTTKTKDDEEKGGGFEELRKDLLSSKLVLDSLLDKRVKSNDLKGSTGNDSVKKTVDVDGAICLVKMSRVSQSLDDEEESIQLLEYDSSVDLSFEESVEAGSVSQEDTHSLQEVDEHEEYHDEEYGVCCGRIWPSPSDTALSPMMSTTYTVGSTTTKAEDKEVAMQCDYDDDCIPLYEKIEAEEWSEVQKFLSTGYWSGHFLSDAISPKEQCGTWVTRYDSRDQCKIIFSQLPLHLAIIVNAPYSIIKTLIKLYPRGVQCVDDQHMLPLHLAMCRGSSDMTVKLILDAFPEGVQLKSKRNMTPIDCAMKYSGHLRGHILRVCCDVIKQEAAKAATKQYTHEIKQLKTQLEDTKSKLADTTFRLTAMDTSKEAVAYDFQKKISQLTENPNRNDAHSARKKTEVEPSLTYDGASRHESIITSQPSSIAELSMTAQIGDPKSWRIHSNDVVDLDGRSQNKAVQNFKLREALSGEVATRKTAVNATKRLDEKTSQRKVENVNTSNDKKEVKSVEKVASKSTEVQTGNDTVDDIVTSTTAVNSQAEPHIVAESIECTADFEPDSARGVVQILRFGQSQEPISEPDGSDAERVEPVIIDPSKTVLVSTKRDQSHMNRFRLRRMQGAITSDGAELNESNDMSGKKVERKWIHSQTKPVETELIGYPQVAKSRKLKVRSVLNKLSIRKTVKKSKTVESNAPSTVGKPSLVAEFRENHDEAPQETLDEERESIEDSLFVKVPNKLGV